MQILNVNLKSEQNKNYPIFIGKAIFSNIGELILKNSKAKKFLIVTDKNVYSLYGKLLTDALNGLKFEFLIFESGEKTKNIQNISKIWDKAVEIKLERKDAIIAFGGGVIGDLAGFAASSYLRGVEFIQIPTTLLAQVDSSVGGKTGIDLEQGKNLVGAFYQPSMVITDLDTLKTLPEKELKTGLAEVLKYAFIEKSCEVNTYKDFLSILKTEKDFQNIVEYSCALKASVVSKDEKESGLRAILNLGHTIGHAIEKCTHYEIFTHGEAIAMGLKAVFFISKDSKLINEIYFNEALDLLKIYELDYKIPKNILIDDIIKSLSNDKKVLNGKVRFVLPTGRAQVEIFENIDEKIVEKAIRELY
jgi:3-dehydroquinate synthase